ncbi:MAG: tryptophan--tRNA ligase, partial [Anaerolineales bacterium]|nr:tryptophan--tRNA ligase [Anaerolineales bacterium]
PTRLRASDPGTVEGNPVFEYHDVFNPNKDEVEDFKTRYRQGKVGDVEVKKSLAAALNAYLRPIRERRAEFLKDPAKVVKILDEGTEKARPLVENTFNEVMKKMGLH